MVTSSYQIDKDDLKRAKEKAKRTGLSLGAVIRMFIKLWLKGEVEISL